jgi:hypothetical protein
MKRPILLFPMLLATAAIMAQSGYIGIGTTTPAYTLDVNGTIRTGSASTTNGSIVYSNSANANAITLNSGATAASYSLTLPTAQGDSNTVLTNNGSGVLSWATSGAATGWATTGNSGTSPSANFIGTTDNESLVFKANNQAAGKIDLSLNNAIFGYQAANSITTGNNSTFMGYQAGYSNTSGPSNTGIGGTALFANTTGSNNTAVGQGSLTNNTTGAQNTAIGTGSMKANTTGASNSGLSNSALYANTTGNYNTAAGMQALYSNISTSSSSAFGYKALYSSTDSGNTAIGANAGRTVTTGSNNTFVGSGADAGSGTLTNATAIGYNAKVNISNAIALGAANTYVGIGTGSPGNFLEIYSGTGGVSGLRMRELPAGAVLFMSTSGDVTQNNNNFYFDATNYRLSVAGGTSPSSTLTVGGSVSVGISTKTASYSASVNDHTILCNNTSGAITITLPLASGCSGRVYVVKKISAAGNNVTVQRNGSGSDLIDGASTVALANQYDALMIQSDGTNWDVILQN